jgi:hypothetical protein
MVFAERFQLLGGQGGVGLFPNHRLRVIGLGVVHGLGMAVAKHYDAVAVVAGHEAAVADLRLTKGVHGSTRRQEVALIREAGLGKQGGFGGLLDAVGIQNTGRGVRLLELGVNPVGEVGAVDFGGGIFGSPQKKETTFLIESGGVCPVVAGSHKSGHGRKNVVPSVGFLPQLAESLQAFAPLLGKVSAIFRGIGHRQGAQLLQLAGGFRLTGGSETAVDGGNRQAGQETQNGNNHQELHQGEGMRETLAHGRDIGGHVECGQKKVGVVTKM